MGDVMSVGAAGRVSWGKAKWFAGAILCVSAAWMLWPAKPDTPADQGVRVTAHPPGQTAEPSWREVDILKVELTQIKLDLKKERRLVAQLQRELQDASRQIDQLSMSAQRLRAALRQGSRSLADGLADQRARHAPRPTEVWRMAESHGSVEAVAQQSRHRGAVRPDARVSSYAPSQDSRDVRSGERIDGRAATGPVTPDRRSRLAPEAATAPRPVVSNLGPTAPRRQPGQD